MEEALGYGSILRQADACSTQPRLGAPTMHAAPQSSHMSRTTARQRSTRHSRGLLNGRPLGDVAAGARPGPQECSQRLPEALVRHLRLCGWRVRGLLQPWARLRHDVRPRCAITPQEDTHLAHKGPASPCDR